jgi:hypothetical protein
VGGIAGVAHVVVQGNSSGGRICGDVELQRYTSCPNCLPSNNLCNL